MTQIPANTPVLIGAGQYTERLDSPHYRALSPVDITAEAAKLALADAGSIPLEAFGLVMTTRTFEDSTPVLAFPFGRSNNFPRSVCQRLGLEPEHTVWATSGGDTPQKLVVEACEAIAAGSTEAVLICGGEAMSTAKALVKQGKQVDWSEQVQGQVDDRGTSIDYLTPEELAHGVITPPLFHGLIENARRGEAGASRADWLARMSALFAPLSAVASENPLAAIHERALSAAELATIGQGNRLIADPYPQRLVARDQVNQSAALVLVSTALADRLGIPAEQRLYLHGHAAAAEPPVTMRQSLGRAPSAGLALKAALERANMTLEQIACFDFYSCFPVAVSNAIEAIGLSADDARGLTLTGGLPFFGGPGNNYSMHALAEMVVKSRTGVDTPCLIAANGGFLSKYAVGIYSTQPAPFTAWSNADLDRAMADSVVRGPVAGDGEGVIETYTVAYGRDGSAQMGVAVGRRLTDGSRFLARTRVDDTVTAASMAADDPLGRLVELAVDEKFTTFRFK